jgi:ppGpp synthetase/RelA/SpoT-type nucleotidyltranferase
MREFATDFPHPTRQQYPYILQPKADGYRSHHMVFSFNDEGRAAPFDGRRVELQIRTRLQHSWATAVEAVGLYRDEDMKAGYGNEEWLRLFSLMSAEFADAENCPVHDNMPSRTNRFHEIKDLNNSVKAASVLENIKNATFTSQNYYFP